MNLLGALVPYLAVLIGMTLFKSAWLTIGLYHAGVIAFLLIRKPDRFWARLWTGVRSPLTGPAVLVCALAAPIIYFMWPLFATLGVGLADWLAWYGLTGWAWIVFIPYFSIVHPILEEAHWRELDPHDGPLLCRGDFLFAGYHLLVLYELIHWPWLLFIFGVLAGSSAFWRWAARRFGGYGLGLATHAAADAGVMLGACLLLKG